MNKPFRVAVIGCGAIAGVHIKGILSSGQTLCALCDPDRERAALKIEKYDLGEVAVYTDFDTLLEQEQPDIVHICTPHHLHAEMCVKALGRNIHVLCEKPLAITGEGLAAILRAEQASKAYLGVCHQNRYEPNMQRLKKAAEESPVSGAFGDVVWMRDAAYYKADDWRGKQLTEGGGVLINQALHTLDLLQWICGMPVSVIGHIANDHLRGTIDVEDTVSARFLLEDGTPLNFFATTAAGKSFDAHVRIRLANKQILHAENGFFINDETIETREEAACEGKRVWGVGHRELIEDFYRSIREGTPFAINGPEAARVVRLILAVYRSHGQETPIPEI